MSFQENLLEAMTNRLAEKEGVYDVRTYNTFELGNRKVVAYLEREESDGYCETCYYEYTVIEYDFDDGTTLVESVSFAELIKEL